MIAFIKRWWPCRIHWYGQSTVALFSWRGYRYYQYKDGYEHREWWISKLCVTFPSVVYPEEEEEV